MKVFNCDDMPDDMQQQCVDMLDGFGKYIPWWFRDPKYLEESALLIQKWLLENGAEEADKVVLIHAE